MNTESKAQRLVLNLALRRRRSCSSPPSMSAAQSGVARRLIKDALFHIDFMTTIYQHGANPRRVPLQRRPNFSPAGVCRGNKRLSYLRIIVLVYLPAAGCVSLFFFFLTMCVTPCVPFDFFSPLLRSFANETCSPFSGAK